MSAPQVKTGTALMQRLFSFSCTGTFQNRPSKSTSKPQTQKERLGAGEAFPKPEKSGTERSKTRRGTDRREVEAGMKTNFLTTLDTASNR
jgi:hypothetical protein